MPLLTPNLSPSDSTNGQTGLLALDDDNCNAWSCNDMESKLLSSIPSWNQYAISKPTPLTLSQPTLHDRYLSEEAPSPSIAGSSSSSFFSTETSPLPGDDDENSDEWPRYEEEAIVAEVSLFIRYNAPGRARVVNIPSPKTIQRKRRSSTFSFTEQRSDDRSKRLSRHSFYLSRSSNSQRVKADSRSSSSSGSTGETSSKETVLTSSCQSTTSTPSTAVPAETRVETPPPSSTRSVSIPFPSIRTFPKETCSMPSSPAAEQDPSTSDSGSQTGKTRRWGQPFRKHRRDLSLKLAARRLARGRSNSSTFSPDVPEGMF